METEVDFNQRLKFSKIRGMILMLDTRFGTSNPYREYLDVLNILGEEHLNELETAMHELLYSPPSKR